jgi:triosephosphate isomerase
MNEKLPIIVANHKANLNWERLSSWIKEVSESARSFGGVIILCPSMPFISSSSQQIRENDVQIFLGVQDVSKLAEGDYTGEVAASQVSDLVDYSIIGHSERRTHFKETDEDLGKKVANSKSANLKVIFCVQDANISIPSGVDIVAYEPIFAIASGTSDTPQNIKAVTTKLRGRGSYKVLYGGSVSAANAADIMKVAQVDGFLIGVSNSLDPQKFTQILEALK